MKRIRFANRFVMLLIVAVLLVASAQPALASSTSSTVSGKQIVLMAGDMGSKFVSVSISGNNQYKQWTTWNKQDKNGFAIAYTKNWWWSESFVQISFTIQNSAGIQTSKTCTFDTLAQPANSPRVEIVYYSSKGCVGGDAGSVRDPAKDAVKPIRDAFTTIWNFLPENKFDFFMTLMNNEINATGCVLGVAVIIKSGGFAILDGTTKSYVQKTCQSTGNMVYQLFTSR
ncbi:MAG: hypothetical protein Q8L64_02460 [bacterium]|nr:hypothetical protein [bacterium]